MSFEDLGLQPALLKAVERMGFTTPTPIQEKIIPEIINGDRDLVGLAQTGTGKTAAFGLPMIQLIDFTAHHTQGVVICPTRELCIQIAGDFNQFCHYIKGAKIVSVYGGASMENQIRQIKKGVQIIIATPGRLLDLMNRKVADMARIQFVVLDEADEMLNMGFQEDLDAILGQTPAEKRTWLFSATMPRDVAAIASRYMKDHVEIAAGKRNAAAANIEHTHYVVMEKDRYAALKRIIDFYPDIYGLIFCRTRNETRLVSERLMKDGYNAEALHGELSQAQRDLVMKKFRDRNLQILVATDVAARGLDVDDITHVINYNFPDEAETYTHRSGRTARAGKSGISIILMNTRERRKLAEVERRTGIKSTYAKVPGGYAICEKQLYALVEKLVAVDVNLEAVEKFMKPVYQTLAGLTKEELIQKFISAEFNRFLDYYKDAEDINAGTSRTEKPRAVAPEGRRPDSRPSARGKKWRAEMNTRSFFINVGKMDNIGKGAITRLLCDTVGLESSQIGKIDMMREFSFFEVDEQAAGNVLKSMKHAKLDGRDVVVAFADRKPPQAGRKKR